MRREGLLSGCYPQDSCHPFVIGRSSIIFGPCYRLASSGLTDLSRGQYEIQHKRERAIKGPRLVLYIIPARFHPNAFVLTDREIRKKSNEVILIVVGLMCPTIKISTSRRKETLKQNRQTRSVPPTLALAKWSPAQWPIRTERHTTDECRLSCTRERTKLLS